MNKGASYMRTKTFPSLTQALVKPVIFVTLLLNCDTKVMYEIVF